MSQPSERAGQVAAAGPASGEAGLSAQRLAPDTTILAIDDGICRPRTFDDLPDQLARPDGLVWVDLSRSGIDTVEFLRARFGFHDLALEDSVRRRQRPKIDEYAGFSYLVFYAARVVDDELDLRQVDVFLGPNYVVTLHDGDIEEVRETQQRWRREPAIASKSVAELLYILLDALVDRYFPVIDAISDRVDDLEELVLTERAADPVPELVRLRRQIMQFRRILGPERDVLNTLLRRESWVLQDKLLVYYQDVYDHVLRVQDQADMLRDLLGTTLDAHLVTVSNQLNAVMRRLTSWTIILMSVALVAGIYGMNFRDMPELGWTAGYPFALGLMLILGTLLCLFFRRRGWL